MLARLVSRLVMLVGSCTAWNMAYNQMVRCHQTRLLVVEMILSIPSSVRLELENMSPGLSLLIWNQLLLVSKSCFAFTEEIRLGYYSRDFFLSLFLSLSIAKCDFILFNLNFLFFLLVFSWILTFSCNLKKKKKFFFLMQLAWSIYNIETMQTVRSKGWL